MCHVSNQSPGSVNNFIISEGDMGLVVPIGWTEIGQRLE